MQTTILPALIAHMNSFLAQGNHQYDYDNAIHAQDMMLIGDVFG